MLIITTAHNIRKRLKYITLKLILMFKKIIQHYSIYSFWHIYTENLQKMHELAFSCLSIQPSVCMLQIEKHILDFSWNFMLGSFTKMCQHLSVMFKIWEWKRTLPKCVSMQTSHNITKYLSQQRLFWRIFLDKNETHVSCSYFSH